MQKEVPAAFLKRAYLQGLDSLPKEYPMIGVKAQQITDQELTFPNYQLDGDPILRKTRDSPKAMEGN